MTRVGFLRWLVRSTLLSLLGAGLWFGWGAWESHRFEKRVEELRAAGRLPTFEHLMGPPTPAGENGYPLLAEAVEAGARHDPAHLVRAAGSGRGCDRIHGGAPFRSGRPRSVITRGRCSQNWPPPSRSSIARLPSQASRLRGSRRWRAGCTWRRCRRCRSGDAWPALVPRVGPVSVTG